MRSIQDSERNTHMIFSMSRSRISSIFSRFRDKHILQNPEKTINYVNKRLMRLTTVNRLREIKETTKDNVTVIEGVYKESARAKSMLQVDGPKDACVLCRLNMDIKYTDVLILSQFLQEDGVVLPRSVTGLCYRQQGRVRNLVRQAHRAGLLQHLRPHVFPSHDSPHMEDKTWKRYNVHFTEALNEYDYPSP